MRPGEELRDYADYCARRFGLQDRVRFGTRVVAATFDESAQNWSLELDNGDALTTRHVIDATGVLTQPKVPDIEGVETFAGTMLHTARWDGDQSLEDQRVAVIGTGASAVQLIPLWRRRPASSRSSSGLRSGAFPSSTHPCPLSPVAARACARAAWSRPAWPARRSWN